MVNKCLVISCTSGLAPVEKKPSLLSLEDQEFNGFILVIIRTGQ